MAGLPSTFHPLTSLMLTSLRSSVSLRNHSSITSSAAVRISFSLISALAWLMEMTDMTARDNAVILFDMELFLMVYPVDVVVLQISDYCLNSQQIGLFLQGISQ